MIQPITEVKVGLDFGLKIQPVVYIGDSGPSISLEDGTRVSVILGQQL